MMKKISITQIKSTIGRLPKHKKTMLGLGLKRIRHTVIREDTPAIRGMINQVSYMIHIKKG